MSKVNLLPLEDIRDNTGIFTGYSVDSDGVIVNTSDCPFPFFETPAPTPQEEETLYKIYNDGGHYIATPYFHSYGKRRSALSPIERVFNEYYNEALKKQRQKEKCNQAQREPLNTEKFTKFILPVLRARFPQNGVTEKMIADMIQRKKERLLTPPKASKTTAIDTVFDSLYLHACRDDLKGEEMTESIKTGLVKLFPDSPEMDIYITDKIEKKKRNVYGRKKRFRRKGYLNEWNYFVTITYDDTKHTPETFRKKLRKCLSNLHTRRGWKYMGVFEISPEENRLHFHGLFYIPDGEMIGKIWEFRNYSTAKHEMQTTYRNTFFDEAFGINDFEEIDTMSLKHGQTLEYIMKYIEKTGERIVYSRGIPTQVCKKLPKTEIVGKLQDFMTKYVLFDDTIDWKRDVMHYTKRKQISIIDILCNPPRVA